MPHDPRPGATAPGGLSGGSGHSPLRSLRGLAAACAEAEAHYSRFVGRLLLVLALVLAVDWYLMREWSAQPPLPHEPITITAPLNGALGAAPYVPADETATMAVDPDELVRGAGFAIALLAAAGASLAFLAEAALRLGALAHRIAVRRAVRRLTRRLGG